MAVLEAVRGWDALKPPQVQVASEATEDSEVEPSAPTEPETEEDYWSDDRLHDLRGTDALAALLDHENHIGSTGDGFPQVRECIILLSSSPCFLLARLSVFD